MRVNMIMRVGEAISMIVDMPMLMTVLDAILMAGMLNRGGNQTAVLHAFDAEDQIGEILNFRCLAFKDHHLKAAITVHVNVSRRHNHLQIRMLNDCELVLNVRLMMVIHDGERGHDIGSRNAAFVGV